MWISFLPLTVWTDGDLQIGVRGNGRNRGEGKGKLDARANPSGEDETGKRSPSPPTPLSLILFCDGDAWKFATVSQDFPLVLPYILSEEIVEFRISAVPWVALKPGKRGLGCVRAGVHTHSSALHTLPHTGVGVEAGTGGKGEGGGSSQIKKGRGRRRKRSDWLSK